MVALVITVLSAVVSVVAAIFTVRQAQYAQRQAVAAEEQAAAAKVQADLATAQLEQLKRDNPSAVPNSNWDPRRLWLMSYREADRTVRLAGLARDGEDVSEFLRRLALSDYFYDVKLLPATKSIDPITKLELVKFEMSAKVRY